MLSQVLLNPINIVFIVLMSGLAVADIISHRRNHPADYRGAIVSLGVLGTFVGVFIGLQGFDTANLRDTIPLLLDGMKTAFLTSIVGMALSIVLTVALHRGKGGDNEITVLTHTLNRAHTELRNTIVEESAQTRQSLDQAIRLLGEQSVDALMQSLARVVSEFNHQLDEQFGENFKELNTAVGRLLVWQENYRELMESDRDLLADIDALHQRVNSLQARVIEGQSAMQQSLNDLVPVLNAMSGETARLDAHQSMMAQSSKELAKVLQTLQTMSLSVGEALSQQTVSVNRLSQELNRQLPSALGQLEETLTGLTTRFAKDYEGFLDHYRELVDQQRS